MWNLFSPKPDQALKMPDFESAPDYTIDLSGSKLTFHNPPQTFDFMVGPFPNKINIFSYETDSNLSPFRPLTIYNSGWNLTSGLLRHFLGFITAQLNLVTAPKEIIGSSSIFRKDTFIDCCLRWCEASENFRNRNYKDGDPNRFVFPKTESDLEPVIFNDICWYLGKVYQNGLTDKVYLFTQVSDGHFIMFIFDLSLHYEYKKTHADVFHHGVDEFVKGLLSHCRLELSPDSKRLKEEDSQP